MSVAIRAIIVAAAGAAVVATSGMATAAVPDDAPSSAPSSAPTDYVPGRVLVHYAADASAADQADLEHGQSAERVGSVPALDVVVLAVPDGAEDRVITALSRSGKVDFAERDGVAYSDAAGSQATNDPYLGQQWGVLKIGTPTAWGTTTGSSSTVIADIDTGADLTHPDLKGRFTSGYDFVNSDTSPQDDQGHGTATAGIIGAATNNSTGIAGMCWSCTIMPVKALNSSGSGSYSNIASAVTWSTDHGADIINMSLGGSSDSSTLHSAVQYAKNHGVVLVASAGNNGSTALTYPGSYSEVINVAGSTSTDSRYSWSTYGSWVKVAAPGCDYTTANGGGYNSSFCGTSAAAPVVSGMVGLMRSLNPAASPADIEAAVTSTAVPVGTWVKYGRVDAAAAVAALGGAAPAPAPAPSTSTWTFSGQLNGGNPARSYSLTSPAGTFTASLSYTRGSSMAIALVDAAGQTVASATGASPVRLSAPVSAGSYTLTVSDGRGSFTVDASTT